MNFQYGGGQGSGGGGPNDGSSTGNLRQDIQKLQGDGSSRMHLQGSGEPHPSQITGAGLIEHS